MLLKDFYKIISLNEINKGEINASIELNSNHKIFAGHFPKNPVVPGVISIQIIKELFSLHLNQKMFTKSARNIKFGIHFTHNLCKL